MPQSPAKQNDNGNGAAADQQQQVAAPASPAAQHAAEFVQLEPQHQQQQQHLQSPQQIYEDRDLDSSYLSVDGEEYDVGRLMLLSHIEKAEQLFLCKQYYSAIYHALCILNLIKRQNVNDVDLPAEHELCTKLVEIVKHLAAIPIIEEVYEYRFEETNSINIITQSLGELNEEETALEIIHAFYDESKQAKPGVINAGTAASAAANLTPFLVNCSRVKLLNKLKRFDEAERVLQHMSNCLDIYKELQDGVDSKEKWVCMESEEVV